MIDILIYIVLGLDLICCVLLTVLVLMQRPKSEGLGAAFGSGFTESIFGAQTSDVLIKMTIGLGTFFFAATLLLAVLYSHRTSDQVKKQLLLSEPAAAVESSVKQTEPTTTPSPTQPVVPSPTETSSKATQSAPATGS
jgi:preprotein translocase subunit SecG